MGILFTLPHPRDDDKDDLDTNFVDKEYLEAKTINRIVKDNGIIKHFDEFEKVIEETLELRLERIT